MRACRQKQFVARTAALHEKRKRFRANRRTNNPVDEFRSPGIKIASLLCRKERKLKVNEVKRNKVALAIALGIAFNPLIKDLTIKAGLLYKPVRPGISGVDRQERMVKVKYSKLH